MAPRIGRRDFIWLGLICGAFVLLTVNVLFGTRGFDRPNAGLGWRVVEAPGIALGWGGVGLLVVALPYALVAWVRGKSPGKTIAVLGTIVFAVGAAGVAAVLVAGPTKLVLPGGYAKGGGHVGAWLAALLVGAIGRALAVAVLTAIAIPGLLLTLAPLFLGTSHLLRAARVPQARAWYPQPQRTEEGEEIPMQLAGTDVGPIRFREPELDSGAVDPNAPPPPPPPVPPPPRSQRLIPGVRYADGGDPDGGPAVAEVADPGTLARQRTAEAERSDAYLHPGVRYAETAPTSDAAASPPAPVEPLAAAPLSEPSESPIEPTPADVAVDDSDAVDSAESETVATSSPVAAIDGGAVERVEAADRVPRHRIEPSETVVDQGRSESTVATPAPKPPPPRRQRPEDIRAALHSLFTNLPVDELPPARISTPADEGAPATQAGREPEDDPAQLGLFVPGAPKRLAAIPEAPPRAPSPPPKSAPPKSPPPKAPPPKSASSKAPPPKVPPPKAPPPRAAPSKEAPSIAKPAHAAGSKAPPTKSPPAKAPLAKPPPAKAPASTGAAVSTGARTKTPAASAPPRASAKGGPKSLPHPACADELYPKAVAAAKERGSASLVHLKRALDVGYSRASALIDAMVADGVLGEMTASGSRPTIRK